jgi:hypothetical protein
MDLTNRYVLKEIYGKQNDKFNQEIVLGKSHILARASSSGEYSSTKCSGRTR